MATELEVKNLALLELGEALLSSLSENREPRRVLDANWTTSTQTCLEAAAWNFATRAVRIDSDPDIDFSFGYTYGFPHPDDWLRTVAISADENFSCALTDYADENGIWKTHVDPIYVKYVSNGASYGMDLATWPANFAKYVAAQLAADSAPRIRESKQETMVKLARMRFSKAVAVDAVGQPPQRVPSGSFVRARAGGRVRDRTGSQLIG